MMGRRVLVALLAAIAAVELGIAVWDLMAGGFRFEVLGVRISSWEAYKPLRTALLTGVAAVWLYDSRATARETTWARLQRAGGAVAVIFVLGWLMLTGVYAARAVGGSDTYGYVSEARLWAAGHLVVPDRLAELAPLLGPAVAPLGYQLAAQPGAIVPTYPPGLPLVMAAAIRVTGTAAAAFGVVPLFGALGIWLTYRLGRTLAEPIAGLYAAAAIGLSPIYVFQSLHPMSDVPVTAWWLLAWVLAWSPRRLAAAAAGAAISMALLTRPNLAPLAVVVAAAVFVSGKDRIARAGLVTACGLPGVVAVAVVNAHLYGSPTSSGYGSLDSLYGVEHVRANLHNYASWLLQLHSPSLLLAIAAPFIVWNRQICLLIAFMAGVLLSYLFYFAYDNWTYLRFLLPAIPMLFVFAGIVIAAAIGRLPHRFRGVAAIPVLLFSLWNTFPFRPSDVAPGQQRYAEIGNAVGRAVPENAAVLALNHSGSLRLYGGRETVRWELIKPDDLDRSVRVLREHGYDPYLLVEDYEEPLFQNRFGAHSAIARLDWPATIEFFGRASAKLFSLDDRERFLQGRSIRRTAIPLR